jgi:Na+/proline symporter
METSHKLPPDTAKRRATVNLWIAVLGPFVLLGIGIGAIAALVPLDPYLGAVCLFFSIVGIVPVLAGFLISLRWKTAHPAMFFLIGLGMSAAAALPPCLILTALHDNPVAGSINWLAVGDCTIG